MRVRDNGVTALVPSGLGFSAIDFGLKLSAIRAVNGCTKHNAWVYRAPNSARNCSLIASSLASLARSLASSGRPQAVPFKYPQRLADAVCRRDA